VSPCSHILRAYWNDIACLLGVVNAIHEALVTRVPITKRFIPLDSLSRDLISLISILAIFTTVTSIYSSTNRSWMWYAPLREASIHVK
jgi:hypothetical protein